MATSQTNGSSYCKVWARRDDYERLPSDSFLTAYMVVLSIASLCFIVLVKRTRSKDVHRWLQNAGVALNKVAKTAKEIERKVFHLAGLLVPLIYQVLLREGYSKQFCAGICWTITILGVTSDLARVHIPFVQRNWPLKSILREKEKNQLCGGSYFSLGCTLAIQLFDPVIAMTSIIFLVLGDMSAALIGRSFGQSVCNIKVGPGGKKSVEGSLGMFFCCFAFGCTIFHQVHLREYAVFVASLVATLVELYEPLGVNDNVSIPVLSSLALTFGFGRTFNCEPSRSPLLWYPHSN
mmetsp:Transcript_64690/g.135731  ORF Transcript_64690/g.135731 Transcript_64690/m.135731 type:complete len:293 (-) Transcript_64690:106-984(-)